MADRLRRTWAMELGLLMRGLVYRGRRHECPVCGWSFRHFVHGGGSFRPRPGGYCPRCNSKGRHRLIWLYLRDNPGLLRDARRLLHVSPHYSLGSRLAAHPDLVYVGVDLVAEPHVCVLGDLTALPFAERAFDATVCVHVLEHVEADSVAIAELYRVTRPGGWVLVNVPMSPQTRTLENVAVRTPRQRREMFGEETHVRVYGSDLVARLEAPGFHVDPIVHRPRPVEEISRFGLPADEKSFLCKRPVVEEG